MSSTGIKDLEYHFYIWYCALWWFQSFLLNIKKGYTSLYTPIHFMRYIRSYSRCTILHSTHSDSILDWALSDTWSEGNASATTIHTGFDMDKKDNIADAVDFKAAKIKNLLLRNNASYTWKWVPLSAWSLWWRIPCNNCCASKWRIDECEDVELVIPALLGFKKYLLSSCSTEFFRLSTSISFFASNGEPYTISAMQVKNVLVE